MTERLPTTTGSDAELIEALRRYNAALEAVIDATRALTDAVVAREETRQVGVVVDDFMYRLSHCDECGCAHGEPLDPPGVCVCVCHGPEDDDVAVSPRGEDPPVGG